MIASKRRILENMRAYDKNNTYTVDAGHKEIIPCRWKPTGWKYVDSKNHNKALDHPNKRHNGTHRMRYATSVVKHRLMRTTMAEDFTNRFEDAREMAQSKWKPLKVHT